MSPLHFSIIYSFNIETSSEKMRTSEQKKRGNDGPEYQKSRGPSTIKNQ
jgi:hypothetical protein